MNEQVVVIAAVLAALQVKHVLADFVFQNQYILDHRRVWGHPGGLLHVAIHAVGTLAVLLPAGLPLALIGTMLLAEAVVHYHIDWAKDNVVDRLGVTPRDRAFWTIFGVDQCLHQLTYVAIALWLADAKFL